MLFSHPRRNHRHVSLSADQLYYKALPELLPLYPALPLAGSSPNVTLLIPSLTADSAHYNAVALVTAATLARVTARNLHIVQTQQAMPQSDVERSIAENNIVLKTDALHLSDASGRSLDKPYYLPLHRDNIIIAAGWAESLLARHLPLERSFVYLVQDYEPDRYPAGERAVLAEASYHDADFIPLCATKPLSDFFRASHYPLFRRGPWFEPTLPNLKMSTGKTAHKRLLMTGTPQEEGGLFELAVQAVKVAFDNGTLGTNWEVSFDSNYLESIALGEHRSAQRLDEQPNDTVSLPDLVIAPSTGPAPNYMARLYAAQGVPVVTTGSTATSIKKAYGDHVLVASLPTSAGIYKALEAARSLSRMTSLPPQGQKSLDKAIATLIRRLDA